MHANKKIGQHALSFKSSTSILLGHVPHFPSLIFYPTLYKKKETWLAATQRPATTTHTQKKKFKKI